jgi:hypothetical protein
VGCSTLEYDALKTDLVELWYMIWLSIFIWKLSFRVCSATNMCLLRVDLIKIQRFCYKFSILKKWSLGKSSTISQHIYYQSMLLHWLKNNLKCLKTSITALWLMLLWIYLVIIKWFPINPHLSQITVYHSRSSLWQFINC